MDARRGRTTFGVARLSRIANRERNAKPRPNRGRGKAAGEAARIEPTLRRKSYPIREMAAVEKEPLASIVIRTTPATTQRSPLVRLCSEAFRMAASATAMQTRQGMATAPPPASISTALCGPENNPVPCPNQKSPTAINSGPTTKDDLHESFLEGWQAAWVFLNTHPLIRMMPRDGGNISRLDCV